MPAMPKFAIILILLIGVLGCHGSQDQKAEDLSKPTVAEVKDPETSTYEQLRAGSYQIGSAVDAVETARDLAQKIVDSKQAGLGEPMLDILDRLDDIGASLADYTDDPPTLDQVQKSYAEFDDQRLNAIESATDSLMAADEISGIIDDLLDQPKLKDSESLNKLSDQMDTCMDALRDAIKALGGKLPPEESDAAPSKTP